MSLEQLAAGCAEVDAEANPAPLAAEPDVLAGPSPADQLAAEIAGLIQVAVAVLAPALPSLKQIYTEQTIAAASSAVSRVCVKRGWLGSGLFGEYGEEISCAVILVPLAVQTYAGVNHDLEAARVKAEAAIAKAREAVAVPVATEPDPVPA